jgi:hypothetical protein
VGQFAWGFILLLAIGFAIAIAVARGLVVSRRAAGGRVTGSWIPLTCLCVVGAVGLLLIVNLVAPHRSEQAVFESTLRRTTGHVHVTSVRVDSVSSDTVQMGFDSGEIWRDVVDEQFDASIYPSTTLAARALGRQVAVHVNFNVLPEDTLPTDIKVVDGFGLDDSSQAAEALAGQLRAEFEAPTEIHPEHFQVPSRLSSPGEVVVILSQLRLQIAAGAPWDSRSRERTGTLQATVMGQRNKVSVATQFIEKPWVTSFDEFISRRPESTFLLARTARVCSTEQAAHLEADERAAESISKMVTPLVLAAAGPGEVRADLNVQVRNTARWLIQSGYFVRDRFAQKLTRPYGEVWREAVLVEVTPDEINGLRRYALEVSQHRQRESVTFYGGLLALFALVVVLYVFLNQATKGYYRPKLAAWLSVGLIVAGMVFALRWNVKQAESVRGFDQVGPYPSSMLESWDQGKTRDRILGTAPARLAPKPTETKPPLLAKPVVTAPPLDEAEPDDGGKIDPAPELKGLPEVE